MTDYGRSGTIGVDGSHRSIHRGHESARHAPKSPRHVRSENERSGWIGSESAVDTPHKASPLREPRLLSGRTNVAVSVFGVVLLIAQLIEIEDGSESAWDLAHTMDSLFCALLLADFVFALSFVSDRKRFLKRHWWEPLASIPMIDHIGHGMLAVRLLRILRLLRIFRLHQSIREYVRTGQDFLERNRIHEVGSILGMTILTGALGFFYAEQGVNPNVHSFRDGVWWALVTVTTIGYGDIYPVTTAGRAIAVVLMVVGIGTVSLFTGMIAAGLLRDNRCPHCGERV